MVDPEVGLCDKAVSVEFSWEIASKKEVHVAYNLKAQGRGIRNGWATMSSWVQVDDAVV